MRPAVNCVSWSSFGFWGTDQDNIRGELSSPFLFVEVDEENDAQNDGSAHNAERHDQH